MLFLLLCFGSQLAELQFAARKDDLVCLPLAGHTGTESFTAGGECSSSCCKEPVAAASAAVRREEREKSGGSPVLWSDDLM